MSVKPVDRTFAIQHNAVRHIDVGTLKDVSAEEILDSINESASRPEQVPNTRKKERRIFKHELFLERLEASRAPYSKSHARRMKRKEREQLVGDLDSLRAALPSMAPTDASGSNTAVGGETSAGRVIDAVATVSSTARASAGGASANLITPVQADDPEFPDPEEARQPTPRPGMIGEGKGKPLSRSQRRYALKAERLRQPLIRSNPEFVANPFETIRIHARNTLVAHHANNSTT